MKEKDAKLPDGMLTYEDAEPIRVSKPEVIMVPVPRKGAIGWIKDRVLGPVMKPLPVFVLDEESQKNLIRNMEAVATCAITAEDVERASRRIITLARGHHIRNADGTVTDVSNDPKYKCAKPEEL